MREVFEKMLPSTGLRAITAARPSSAVPPSTSLRVQTGARQSSAALPSTGLRAPTAVLPPTTAPRLLLAALLALALSLAFATPHFAWAEEGEEPTSGQVSAASERTSTTGVDNLDENRVDPTQRADNSFIYDTTIATIQEQSSLYEGRTVQVVGEVIGDRIAENPGRCWITLTETNKDDPATITVLMSNELANQIDRYGRYGVVGTTLQVRGTYYQACSEHDGQPDIHATNTSVLAHGIDQPDEFNPNDFVPGVLAVLVGVLMMGAFYFVRERTR